MHDARTPWILAFSLAVVSLGCDSGDGDDDGTATMSSTPMTATNPTDDTPTGGEETGAEETAGETGSGAVSYTMDIQPIWDANCVVGCHTAGGSGDLTGMLILTPDMSYAELVGPMSTEALALKLVEGGNPDNSYLWHKLNGTFQDVGGNGAMMPLTGMLSPTQLGTIEAWIDGGALP